MERKVMIGASEEATEAILFAEIQYGESGLGTSYRLDDESETKVIAAYEDDKVVGTLSLTLDQGLLPGEHLFPNEIGAVRHSTEGRLGSLWRLAVLPESDAEVVLGLMDEAFDCGISLMRLDRVICIVSPRHAPFYRRTCGMRRKAGPARDWKLLGAEAVLLVGEVADMFRRWRGYRKDRALGLMDWHC